MVCDGNRNLNLNQDRMGLIKRAIFLQIITQIGMDAFWRARNLVVVVIPEGVDFIGVSAFSSCSNLVVVDFPSTLTSIRKDAFGGCTSLAFVELRHTNLQELGAMAFSGCKNLACMYIPDSLDRVVNNCFTGCTKIVPETMNIDNRYQASKIVNFLWFYQTEVESDVDY